MFRIRTLSCFLAAIVLLTACGSKAPKRHPDGGTPVGADGSSLPDTGTQPEAGVDAAADAAPDTETDSAVPDAAPDAVPDADVPDVTPDVASDASADAAPDASADAATDAAADAAAEACTVNACGTCTQLSALPGELCGQCGTYQCSSDGTSLVCNDPGTNACGTCTTLAGKPGDSCGTCGKLECSTDGKSLVCNDPGANACGGCSVLAGKPGDSCGTCGGTLACNGTDTLTCSGATPTNVCNGCTTLANPPGTTCGMCGSGQYVCDTTETTKCSDPVTTPAPGTSCGTCGSSQYVCSNDKLSTTCQNPNDTNACGGCGTLPGSPGSSCGTCGTYQCSGTSLVCVEGTPKVGTSCGTCGTSSYVCSSPGKTLCQTPDDRTTGPDMLYTNAATAVQVPLSLTTSFGVTYVPGRDGNLVSTTLVIMARQVAGKTIGTVTLSAYVGTPGGKTSTLLDQASVPGDSISLKAASKVLFKFPKQPKVTKGTPMYFALTTTSDLYQYLLYGDGKGAGPDILFAYDAKNGWVKQPFSPWVDVRAPGLLLAPYGASLTSM